MFIIVTQQVLHLGVRLKKTIENGCKYLEIN